MSVNPHATIGELGALLRKKQIASLELTRLYLDRLEKHGTALGAVVTITGEPAEADATLRFPFRAEVRSFNLATSAALALGEALRQTGELPA